MPRLWVTKASPGKGVGVFATEDIKAGTLILRDFSVMHLPRTGQPVSQNHINFALTRMSPADRLKFTMLHQGPAQGATTRDIAILQANGFGNATMTYIYLDVSRINHSCMPNAEIDENNDTLVANVYAIRDIQKGAEIYYCYNDVYKGATRSQRKKEFADGYGFVCTCSACTNSVGETELSDARRQIIHCLSHKLRRQNPPDLSPVEGPTSSTAHQSRSITNRMPTPLHKPLSLMQKTNFALLLAMAYAAEDLRGEAAATAWWIAAMGLLLQLEAAPAAATVSAACRVMLWAAKAQSLMKRARSAGAADRASFGRWLAGAKGSVPWVAAREFLHQKMMRGGVAAAAAA